MSWMFRIGRVARLFNLSQFAHSSLTIHSPSVRFVLS